MYINSFNNTKKITNVYIRCVRENSLHKKRLQNYFKIDYSYSYCISKITSIIIITLLLNWNELYCCENVSCYVSRVWRRSSPKFSSCYAPLRFCGLAISGRPELRVRVI